MGYDPGQLAFAFLSGPQKTADQLDVTNDLIPYFSYDAAHDRYIQCVVSPQDLYAAMVADA